MYNVKAPSTEMLALEALQVDVQKHNEGKLPKEKVHNTLQEYRGSISESMASIIELDKKTAGEYLDSSMAIRYQQRVADIAGELLAASAKLSHIANNGSLYIIPIVQPTTLTRKITAYRGSVITYENARGFLRSAKLYTSVLRSILPIFDIQFFTEASKAEEALGAVAEKIKTFDSPVGKFITKNTGGNLEVEFSEKRAGTKEGFTAAGWTATKLTDYQTEFSDIFMDLSKSIYTMSQAMNRFTMNSPQARVWSLFVVFAERLTEALVRIALTLVEEYRKPWNEFYTSIHGE